MRNIFPLIVAYKMLPPKNLTNLNHLSSLIKTKVILDIQMTTITEKILDGAQAREAWKKPLSPEPISIGDYNQRCDGNFVLCGDIRLDEDPKRQTTLTVHIDPANSARWKKESEHIYAIVCNGQVMKLGGTRTGMEKRWSSYKCGYCVPQRVKRSTGKPFPGKMSVTNAHLYHTIEDSLLKGDVWQFWSWELPQHTVSVQMPTGVSIDIATQTYHGYESWCIKEFRNMAGHIPQLCDNSDPNYR